MKRLLHGISDTLSVIEAVLIGVFSIAGLAVGTMQVVLRYVFNTGFPWSESIFILLTVTAMLMAGSRAVRDDAHVRVDLVPMLATPGIRKFLQILGHVITFALCAYLLYAGIKYVQFAKLMDTAAPDTGIKDWIIWLVIPIAMGAFCIRYAIRIILALRDEDHVVAHSVSSADTESLGGRS